MIMEQRLQALLDSEDIGAALIVLRLPDLDDSSQSTYALTVVNFPTMPLLASALPSTSLGFLALQETMG